MPYPTKQMGQKWSWVAGALPTGEESADGGKSGGAKKQVKWVREMRIYRLLFSGVSGGFQRITWRKRACAGGSGTISFEPSPPAEGVEFKSLGDCVWLGQSAVLNVRAHCFRRAF
jgi:hypothetical protein